MEIQTLTALLFGGAFVAGALGSLTGLGGGVVIVPLLTLVLGVDIQYAIGTALVSVIATSSASAAAYVKEGYSNVRIGMFFEVATTIGAVVGASVAAYTPNSAIAIVFGVVLLAAVVTSLRGHAQRRVATAPNPLATRLRLNGSMPKSEGGKPYFPHRVPLAWAIFWIAGLLSGLLGIGSGALKVLAMDDAMGLPYKVSTTTSNFMIGVTAAASAGVYLQRGYVDPILSTPVVLGVLLGAMAGTRILVVARVGILRVVFAVVIAALGVQMLIQGLRGAL